MSELRKNLPCRALVNPLREYGAKDDVGSHQSHLFLNIMSGIFIPNLHPLEHRFGSRPHVSERHLNARLGK
jgi:hypothetical protein